MRLEGSKKGGHTDDRVLELLVDELDGGLDGCSALPRRDSLGTSGSEYRHTTGEGCDTGKSAGASKGDRSLRETDLRGKDGHTGRTATVALRDSGSGTRQRSRGSCNNGGKHEAGNNGREMHFWWVLKNVR